MSLYPNAIRDDRVRDYVPAVRVVASANVANPEFFVGKIVIQSHNTLTQDDFQELKPGAWILLDFGREMAGGVRLTTAYKTGSVRIRFGESVSEAMSTPNQDHSIHDTMQVLPKMGCLDFGSTGFRFVRVDSLSSDIQLMGITAIANYRDLPRVGTFECSDPLVNKVYDTAVYTVQVNMQDYIYDGIKRDRLAWLGDLNPEIRVILGTFGDLSLVRKSLDFVRDYTPLPKYMNGIITYSVWWIINQHDLYMQSGDMAYLQQQKEYLIPLVKHFASMIEADGHLNTNGTWCFLDWPTNDDHDVQAAGGHGLFAMMFERAAILCRFLGDEETAKLAEDCRSRMAAVKPDCKNNKTAAAMLTLSGIVDKSAVLTTDATRGVSTFYGYYMLLGQPVASALDVIRAYWGGMLAYGATTFWEDFDLDWLENACRIDELPVAGKKDLHADYGKYCYIGLRHSLCHGWSGGPAAFLMEKVLGVSVLEPGAKKLLVKPDLGNLDYAKGTYPTPFGPVAICKKRGEKVSVTAPAGVEVVVED